MTTSNFVGPLLQNFFQLINLTRNVPQYPDSCKLPRHVSIVAAVHSSQDRDRTRYFARANIYAEIILSFLDGLEKDQATASCRQPALNCDLLLLPHGGAARSY